LISLNEGVVERRALVLIKSMTKTKICQNCHKKFTIEPEDFEFYKKIEVPEPTFCPECRAQRRFAFCNLMELYKRKCDFSNKDIISIYRSDSPFKIYHSKIWWSDKWDPMDYGRNYDFKQPFLEQFKRLMLDVPRPHNFNLGSVNCDYCAGVYNCKNCYMCVGNRSEDCLYSFVGLSRNCLDSFFAIESENCYENIFCHKNYNLYFSQFTDNCIDSAFLYDCRNCQNCFACVNLRNKKYHIFNKPYAKEEYKKEMVKYSFGSHKNVKKTEKAFYQFRLKFPRRFARVRQSRESTGDNISNVNNCYYCFNSAQEIDKCKYIFSGGWHLKDSYDIFDGGTNSELLYEIVTSGNNAQKVFFSVNVTQNVYNIEYSNECYSSSNLFGCVGLRHKKYCILNKQYTKKDYEELVPKIKEHMNTLPYLDRKGRAYRYGEFFPIELSPFDYNKSVAQEHFSLTKEQALKQGYRWYDKPKPEHKPTVKAKDLPDNIKDVDDSILKEVIECENASSGCEGAGVFKIIPNELRFYQKHNISLPRLCPACRMWTRLKQRNPLKLWKRQCQCAGEKSSNGVYQNTAEHKHKNKPCPNTFQTTYAPDRPEIVYCEKCYQKEAE